MPIRWSDIALGEFAPQGSSLYALKIHNFVGESQAIILYKDANVVVSKHNTTRGRTVGYSVELLKDKVRLFRERTYLIVITGPKPTPHTFVRNIVEEQLFVAALYKAGKHRDYMFLNRLREEEDDYEEEEAE